MAESTKPFLLRAGDYFTIDRDPDKTVFKKLQYDNYDLDIWALKPPYKLVRVSGTLDVTPVSQESGRAQTE
jgi:hypothetical protein